MNTNNYQFTFDDIGNREYYFFNNSPVEYDCNSVNQYVNKFFNNMSTNIFTSYHYDSDGNLVDYSRSYNDGNGSQQQFAWIHTWNGENRMTSATNYVDATYVTYKYDYQGRMFEKTTNGDTTRFIWNGNHIIAEFSEASTNLYVWANGEILTASLNGETVFYCHDANKNVTDLVDTSGDSVVHYEYSPFGVITEQTGSLAAENPFRFSNEYFDETTGFVEYKRHPYIPPLGKFASRDPIGIRGGQNEYMFCNNNAINFWDYLGREPKRPKSADYEILDLSSFVRWRYELVYRLGNLPPLKPETRVQSISLSGNYPARHYRSIKSQNKKSNFGCWKAYYLTVYAEPILGFNSKGSIGSPFDSRNRLRFEPQIAIVKEGEVPSQYSKTWSKPGMIYMGIIGLKTTGKYMTYKNYRWGKGKTSIKLDVHRRIKRTYLDNFLDDEEVKADERAFRNVPVISDNDKIQKLDKLTFELENKTEDTL